MNLQHHAPSTPSQPGSPVCLFSTGFEGTTRLIRAAGPYFHGAPEQYEDFAGADPTVGIPNDWALFSNHPMLGTFRLYHEGGDESQRWARIVQDDTNPANHVLRFHIAQPNVVIQWADGPQRKSRVQSELYGSVGFREFYQSVRVRLHPDTAKLRDYPHQIHWFTLAEFWANAGWTNEEYPFRFGLHLVKPDSAPGTDLYFASEAQKQVDAKHYERIWHHDNRAFPIPFGTWMTIESYYKEGDASHGRFYVAVTPEGGPRTVIFDIHDTTHHPENPTPSGLKHYSPLKLYTSAELVDFLREQGTPLEVDWDDFSLWQNRTPESR